MNKKYYPSAFILYLNYFIHGIGCSILGQAVIKEMLVAQWGQGMDAIGQVTMVAAALGLGRLISLPIAGPLSDKMGRKLSSLIGIASYAIFFIGVAMSANMWVAYAAAILGGIANSFLDTGVIPACVLTKFFISAAQLLLPFMLGALAGASLSYNVLLYISGIAILIIGVLVIFAPMPKAEKAAGEKAPGLLENIRNSHFSAESIALIVIGFTCTATFQLWLNCAQTFAKDLAGVSDPSMMQTYYSFGSLAAIIITAGLVSRIKGVRFLFVYPLITLITLVLVYVTRSETMCYIGAALVGYSAGGVILQLVTATANDLFPHIKGTITSIVMIMSSLSNYTILSVAGTMNSAQILMMNIVITVIGVLLALFVNLRFQKLAGK